MKWSPAGPLLCLSLWLAGCGDDKNPTHSHDFTVGKNRFTLEQAGSTREYYVHVPTGYDGHHAVPLVLMLHGTNQSGEQFYNISGWKDVGESEGILTAYPTARVNCVIEDGATETLTKWNSYPDNGGWSFCAGVTPPDDEGFLRALVADMRARYNVDARRVYVVGFSNGGEMSARCSVYLSDVFAAAVMSGGGGALPRTGAGTPVRLLPVLSEFGNRDGKLLAATGQTDPLPMNFTTLFTTLPGVYAVAVTPFVNTFQLDAANFTLGGDAASYITADFHGVSGQPNNVFKLVEVNGLEHEYPNTINHPLNGAALHWQWLRQFTLPS